MSNPLTKGYRVRSATTADVPQLWELIDLYAPDRRLLSKALVTLYEDIQDFMVAEADGEVIGCGALHVMWRDLAEVRTVAVCPKSQNLGVGSSLVSELINRAQYLGISRIFCLTFETEFFTHFGFQTLEDSGVPPHIYAELMKSGDEGVAEFLDLERVKPNTLGNHRMILRL